MFYHKRCEVFGPLADITRSLLRRRATAKKDASEKQPKGKGRGRGRGRGRGAKMVDGETPAAGSDENKGDVAEPKPKRKSRKPRDSKAGEGDDAEKTTKPSRKRKDSTTSTHAVGLLAVYCSHVFGFHYSHMFCFHSLSALAGWGIRPRGT